MVVACALTAVLTLTLLPRGSAASASGGAGSGGPGTASASLAKAEECEDPEASVKPSRAEGPTIDEIKTRTDKPNKLIVGIDQNSYRWGYRDPNSGELKGFDIDLARRIAKDVLGDEKKIVFRAIPTNQRIPAIQNGTVDMVVRTMTISCDRLADVSFSTAYFETGQQLLVPRDSKIDGYNDKLKGKRLCSAAGSTALSELKKKAFGADISTVVPNQLDCLVRLQLGEVDGVVTDSALAAGQAAQDPTVRLAGKTFTHGEYYGVAMKKGADDLVARVNQVLVDYRKNGWKKSYDAWLSADLGKGMEPPDPKYLKD
ncbi:transporter substrate-binding domain-containing protein [Streptomyces tsukubensis]|nr:transporter substrate-binding domain-containing protein [Streptomyces tsukubensis]